MDSINYISHNSVNFLDEIKTAILYFDEIKVPEHTKVFLEIPKQAEDLLWN